MIELPIFQLEVGSGGQAHQGWTSLDVRPLKGVDIVHDMESIPWPLASSSVRCVRASHVLEHILPRSLIPVMDEIHRILQPNGTLWVAAPYGVSPGWIRDPTHTKPISEETFDYFTPIDRFGGYSGLYEIYRPAPWRWIAWDFVVGGDLTVLLKTVKES